MRTRKPLQKPHHSRPKRPRQTQTGRPFCIIPKPTWQELAHAALPQLLQAVGLLILVIVSLLARQTALAVICLLAPIAFVGWRLATYGWTPMETVRRTIEHGYGVAVVRLLNADDMNQPVRVITEGGQYVARVYGRQGESHPHRHSHSQQGSNRIDHTGHGHPAHPRGDNLMRTLFVGDLHAKADLLPLITRVARREHAERIVLLGDICDDWNVSNNGLVRFFDTFAAWYRRESLEREVIPLLGNHDVPYFLKQGSSSYARVRALAPGFKPGAHRKVHELMQNIPFQLAWSDGNILATHAGLTRAWGRRRLGADYMDMPVEEVADRLNRMLLHPASLVVPMTDIGSARGGAGTPSPLWCDRGEFAEDGDMHLTQVVGHTPVPTVLHEHDAWFCDTFSTMSNGTPIGDGSLLMYSESGFYPVPLLG